MYITLYMYEVLIKFLLFLNFNWISYLKISYIPTYIVLSLINFDKEKSSRNLIKRKKIYRKIVTTKNITESKNKK